MRTHFAVALGCLLGAAGVHGAEPSRLLFAPAQPTDSDRTWVTVLGDNGIACGAYFFDGYDLDARRVRLLGYRADPPQPCGPGTWTSQVALQRLAPGDYTVEATLDGDPFLTAPLTVGATPTATWLGEGGYFGSTFEVSLRWRDPWSGEMRDAPVVRHSSLAANFWFFDPDNPEVAIKILDGSAINAHFWLFVSSMTTVEFTLRVRHCVDGDPPFCAPIKEITSAAGENLDLVDVEAFQ